MLVIAVTDCKEFLKFREKAFRQRVKRSLMKGPCSKRQNALQPVIAFTNL